MKSKFLQFVGDKAFVTFCGMLILFMCVSTLIGFGFYALKTGKTLEPVGLIVTFLTTTTAGLLGYWWGSSSSSKEKDATIQGMGQNIQDILTTTTTLPA